MERTSTNVKDKWKEIGGKNWELRKKEFDFISTLKMLKYINEGILLDIKNQWSKLLKDLNLDKKCQITQDLKMINYIVRNGYENIDEVNFSKIKNKM